MRALDRDGVIPLYFQLAAALLERLETGAWPPGAHFATERELEETFGVSRSVVRKALELLVGDGAIVRRRGAGAFVAEPRREMPLFGLVKALAEEPDDVGLDVLTARRQKADAAISHFLEMRHPTPIAHVTAVLRVAGRPFGLIDSRTSAGQVPWLLSVADAMRRGVEPPPPGRVELSRATVVIEHTYFGQWGGPTVGVPPKTPALMGRLIQYGRGRRSGAERPLEFARVIYRSDRAQLAVELD